MGLTAGARVGPYEITGPLGSGGMGEVYRATDARLSRVVAIKALHSVLVSDPERVGRFEREAQLLASLNHPNIAAIHGLEEVAGETYLVLEFVDGRPLSEVLKNGALPVAEAIAFARQIADALAAAHERGIIHRDIKPGNIMITGDGAIKVLDFGLGKALDGTPGSDSLNSPTMTLAATQAGLILGTAAYMSPEQAKGRAADKRSDVWGFGCVLFEMLTGARAFAGEDITETLAAIVRGEPDWKALPADVPPAVRELLERCLVKQRGERLPDMSVVRYVLGDQALSRAAATAPAARASRARWRSIPWPVAAGLMIVAVLATAGVVRFRASNAPADDRVMRFAIALPDGDSLAQVNQAPLAISPDGSNVVYAARRNGTQQLFVRNVSAPEAAPLAGTEGGKSPFFSADGRWVGFFAQGKVKKIAVGGAGLQTVTDAGDGRGGSWAPDGSIYFAPTNTSGIWRVSAAGGTAVEVTRPDAAKGEISHIWPDVLADGETMLFGVRSGPGPDEHVVVSQSLKTGARHTLVEGGDMPRRVASGHLVYGRFDELFATPWTASQRDLGGAVPLRLPETPRLESEGASAYAVSDNGTLVYVAGGPSRLKNRIVWVNRQGAIEALPVPEKEYESVAISPDERHAVVQIAEGTMTLWMLDFERNSMTPFAVAGGSSQAPVWTPDGKQVLYRGTRMGFRNIYRKSADGAGSEERMTTAEGLIQTPTSVSPDGKWLLLSEGGGMGGSGLRLGLLPLEASAGAGSRAPRPFLPEAEAGFNGHFSPDGRWVAYQSSLSGRFEVYVTPFPGPGPRRQVSTLGGAEPRWSRDGRQLYFLARDNSIMAVDLTAGGSTAGAPRLVRAGPFKEQVNANTAFDVARDGRILIVQLSAARRAATHIDVVLNWFAQLRSGAPAR